MAQRNQFPKQSTLTLAIAAALATMVPAVAAADTTISTAVNSGQSWGGGNFTVTSTGSIIPPGSTALSSYGSGGPVSNSGTISGLFNAYVGYGGGIDTLNNTTGGTITGISYAGTNGANSATRHGGAGAGGGSGTGVTAGNAITTLNNSGMIGGTGGNGGTFLYNPFASESPQLQATCFAEKAA